MESDILTVTPNRLAYRRSIISKHFITTIKVKNFIKWARIMIALVGGLSCLLGVAYLVHTNAMWLAIGLGFCTLAFWKLGTSGPITNCFIIDIVTTSGTGLAIDSRDKRFVSVVVDLLATAIFEQPKDGGCYEINFDNRKITGGEVSLSPSAPPARPVTPSLFLSYRRADTLEITGRLFDWLVKAFGENKVFKDTESIRGGEDFTQSIENQISSCNSIVIVIGPKWLSSFQDGGASGVDYVRFEIELALARGVHIFPILVGGALMPSYEQLPSAIAPLAFRQSMAVRGDPDFKFDVERFIQNIKEQISLGQAK